MSFERILLSEFETMIVSLKFFLAYIYRVYKMALKTGCNKC